MFYFKSQDAQKLFKKYNQSDGLFLFTVEFLKKIMKFLNYYQIFGYKKFKTTLGRSHKRSLWKHFKHQENKLYEYNSVVKMLFFKLSNIFKWASI